MHRRPLVLTATAVVGFALVLTGCAPTSQGQAGPPMAMTPVRVPQDAAALPDPGATAAAEPVAPAVEPVAFTAATLNPRIAAAQQAVTGFDFLWTFTDATAGQTVLQGTVVNSATPDFAATVTSPTGRMDVRMIAGKMYMNAGPLTGNKFLLFGEEDADSFGFADLSVQLDPTRGATGTSAAITAVVPVGPPEVLDGIETQRYDVTFDRSKVPAELAQDLPDDDGQPTITFSYWIGPDDLPRKLRAAAGAQTTELLFSHFGAPGPVVAPTPDQIATDPHN